MKTNQDLLKKIFNTLNERIVEINKERLAEGLLQIYPCEVTLLGQMSLLASEKAALILTLAQTADMDALLLMDHLAKEELKHILKEQNLVYDDDSYLIWIPPGAIFEELFRFSHVLVKAIDPESALVSKAVKAPAKNKQLLRAAIASGEFTKLVDRIIANGGKLENFV